MKEKEKIQHKREERYQTWMGGNRLNVNEWKRLSKNERKETIHE